MIVTIYRRGMELMEIAGPLFEDHEPPSTPRPRNSWGDLMRLEAGLLLKGGTVTADTTPTRVARPCACTY